MTGNKKLIFNPFIKGNFDYINDYDSEIETLQNNVNHINSETIGRVDSIENIISMLQSGQIIPAQRQGTIENGDIIYNVTYENYATLKGAKKFFVILDNPLQTGSTSAEELVKLKVQTDKLKHITVAPPTVSDTPSETDLYAGMVGYNVEKNLGILITGGYVYLKQGAYAKTDVFDLKCTYSIDENGKAHLIEYVEPEPPAELEEGEEPQEMPEPTLQPIIIVISERNENKITFETTNGYFQLPDNSSVNFTDQLIITEGYDTWSVLRVMHKDSIDAKLKDILEKRVLMRAIIDEKDSAQDSAYIIGGAMENTPPASFIKANAFVIDSLEEDLILDNDHFPTESVIYIVKAKNDFNVGGFSRIVFNNNNTGFTIDRSFEIWLEKDTGQRDMLLVKNGTVESNALNRGECVRLFFDYQTSHWSIVYIGADNVNNTLVTSNDGTITVTQTGQTFDLSRDFYTKKAAFSFYGHTNYAIRLASMMTGSNGKGAFSFDISSLGMPHLFPYYGEFLVDMYLTSDYTKFRCLYFGGEYGGYPYGTYIQSADRVIPADFVLIRKSNTEAELWKTRSWSKEEGSQIGIKLNNTQKFSLDCSTTIATQTAFQNYAGTKIYPLPFPHCPNFPDFSLNLVSSDNSILVSKAENVLGLDTYGAGFGNTHKNYFIDLKLPPQQ